MSYILKQLATSNEWRYFDIAGKPQKRAEQSFFVFALAPNSVVIQHTITASTPITLHCIALALVRYAGRMPIMKLF